MSVIVHLFYFLRFSKWSLNYWCNDKFKDFTIPQKESWGYRNIKTGVWFVFTPVVCRKAHVLITLFLFVCLRIVVFNTYYFVFLLCFSSSMLPVFLDCSILIAPSVFCNVYLVSPSGEGCNRSKMILPVEQIKYPMTLKANML